VLPSESRSQGSGTLSLKSLVADEEGMRSVGDFQWLRSVLFASFSPLTLFVWVTGRASGPCHNLCHISPHIPLLFFWNSWRKRTHRDLANPVSPGKRALKWSAVMLGE